MPNAKPPVTQNPARKKIISRMAPVLVRPILEHMFVKCYQCTMSINYIYILTKCAETAAKYMDQSEVLLQDWPGCEPSMSQCPLHSFAVCIPLLHADRTPFLYLLHPKLCMELPRFSTSYFFEPRPTHEASGLQAVEYHAAYTGRIWHTDTHSIL